MDIQPFKINIPQDQLDDLHDRLTHARLPNQIPVSAGAEVCP